jgi:hypothetical protein
LTSRVTVPGLAFSCDTIDPVIKLTTATVPTKQSKVGFGFDK